MSAYRALDYAKKLHIDECEAVLVKKRILTVRITDSSIAEIKQNQDEYLGIRIIHEGKISTAQTSNLDNVSKLVEQALQTTEFLKPIKYWKSLPPENKGSKSIENLFDKKLVEISGIQATDLAQSMINAATQPKVSSISGSLNIVSENFEIANTSGLSCSDNATYISGTINADSEGATSVSGIGQASCRTLRAFSAESVGADAAEMCVASINPIKPEAGEYSIIFDPYSVGELLAFVFASNFSLKVYSDKRSCFSEKLDSKISVEDFNLIDDAHAPEGLGSKPFDDEGVPTNSKHLIENGIFKNLYSDSFHAFKEGKESSGNASRPGSPMGRNAEPIPIPSPHNLRISGNETSREDIIKDTKKGLLIGRLWYTYAVNPTRGDFSCTARSGIRIIENGQIKSAGTSVRIVHNLPIMIKNISAIGNDSKNVLQWASLPSIAPTIRADGIRAIPI